MLLHLSLIRVELKAALRGLARSPFQSLALLLVLALGLGTNTAFLAHLDHLMWRPMGFREAGLVQVGSQADGVLVRDLNALRRESGDLLSSLGGYTYLERVDVEGVSAQAFLLSEGFPEALGLRPVFGEGLPAEACAPGAPPAVVLSHRFWRTRLGGDPGVMGRPLRVQGVPMRVAGVWPEAFQGVKASEQADLWFNPSAYRAAFDPKGDWERVPLTLLGRLRPGQDGRPLEARLAALAGPGGGAGDGWRVQAYRRHGSRREAWAATRGFVLLQAGGLLVALAAFATAALYQAGRLVDRRGETALRGAMGATQGQLMGSLVAEQTLLGALSVPFACLAAQAGQGAVARLVAPLGGAAAMAVGSRVALATALLAMALSLVCAIAGAWVVSRRTPSRMMAELTQRVALPWMSRLLIALQVAAAVLLLALGGLARAGVERLVEAPLGFDVRRTLLMELRATRPEASLGGAEGEALLRQRLEACPGVRGVTLGFLAPFGDTVGCSELEDASGRSVDVDWIPVDRSFFPTLGIPLLAGRAPEGPGEAVVSASLARRLWPGAPPFGAPLPGRSGVLVGVASEALLQGRPERSLLYTFRVPKAKASPRWITARVEGDPERRLPALRAAVDEGAPGFRVGEARSMADQVRRSRPEAGALQAGLLPFGLLTLLVAGFGVAGLTVRCVGAARRECGLRLALGSTSGRLVALVLGRTLRPALWGTLAGAALAFGLARLGQHQVRGLDPRVLSPYVLAALALGLTALASALVPALGLVRLSPAEALRSE